MMKWLVKRVSHSNAHSGPPEQASGRFYRLGQTSAWIWVGLCTLFLYATLPFARSWQIFARDLFGSSFSPAMNLILIAGGISILWIVARKNLGFRFWFSLAIIIVAAGGASQIARPEERIHLLEYGILGYLIALAVRWSFGGAMFFIASLSVGSFIGLGDELIQFILPSRVFDWRDVAMNSAGTILGLTVMWLNRQNLRRSP